MNIWTQSSPPRKSLGSPGCQFVYVSTSFVAVHLNVPSVAESVASSHMLPNFVPEKFAHKRQPVCSYNHISAAIFGGTCSLRACHLTFMPLIFIQRCDELIFCVAFNDDQVSAQLHASGARVGPRQQFCFDDVTRTVKHFIALR